jgi:hypothetical protein
MLAEFAKWLKMYDWWAQASDFFLIRKITVLTTVWGTTRHTNNGAKQKYNSIQFHNHPYDIHY